MIRIAAVGDVHVGTDMPGAIRERFASVADRADVLLIAGDLTKTGRREEAEVLAAELAELELPVACVLGNHDHHSDAETEVARIVREAGVEVLEGDATVIRTAGGTLGVAGVKGFGGGFVGSSGSEFGEREMKAFIHHSKDRADALAAALGQLDADLTVALMHYSPVRETLEGEPPEIFPFLGSYLLAEAIDTAGADLALHGHAHRGTEEGVTPGGVPVRNVASTILATGYAIYAFETTADRGSLARSSA